MIHTVELLFPIDYTDVRRLFLNYNVNPDKFQEFGGAVRQLKEEMMGDGQLSAYTLKLITCEGKGVWNLRVKVDVLKIIGRSDFTEAEYKLVEADIRRFLTRIFGHSAYFNAHRLTRIDYRFDVVIDDVNRRKLIFHLFEKYTKKYGYKEKIKWGKDDNGKPFKYETSQYHRSESVEFIIYSKEDEFNDKNKKGLKEVLEPYERDVIRYELRLKNDHLNGMTRKDKGRNRPKKLKEYFKDELYADYMRNHLYPIIGRGDYYKISKGEKIVENSPLTRRKKEKLRAFLVNISEKGIDAPKEKLHPKTHRQYLKELESLGINPILIPKNRKDFPSFMKNPFNL